MPSVVQRLMRRREPAQLANIQEEREPRLLKLPLAGVTSVTEFCLYEGPKDQKHYWQTFRLVAEDAPNVEFFEYIDPSLPTSTLTCLDKDYDYKLTIQANSNFTDVQNKVIFQFLFRRLYPLNDILLLSGVPMLIYVRDPYIYSIGELSPSQPEPGHHFVTDFAAH